MFCDSPLACMALMMVCALVGVKRLRMMAYSPVDRFCVVSRLVLVLV